MRAEQREIHDSLFENLVVTFDEVVAHANLVQEMSFLMKTNHLQTKFVNYEHVQGFAGIVKTVLCQRFVEDDGRIDFDISKFLFHGSSLALWLITYEIVKLSKATDFSADEA